MENHWSDREYASNRRRRKGEPSVERGRKNTAHPVETPVERAILIGAGGAPPAAEGTLPMLDELAELARTAGAIILGRLYQRRDHPDPARYIGQGKALELKALCEQLEANVVIADDDLSPAQVRNLEEDLCLRVIDRSELIIHIFAVHARTRQSRLQVELAQMKYLAPRLKRMWTHLSRITGAGGIGSRGPGEKQIEVDRRIIQQRIQELTEELRDIEGRKERQVGQRSGTFKAALVGYTNAGKSTLMNRLTGSDVLVADQLFATLDTRTRRCPLGDSVEVLLSDTVGFIEKLPHHLVASFHATLEEVREANLLLHVADASDPDAEKKVRVVREVLAKLGVDGIPELLVLNKIDLLPDRGELMVLSNRLDATLLVSATSGEGMEQLRQAIRERATVDYRTLELRIPAGDGRTLARLASTARVLSREYEGEYVRVTASVPEASVSSLAGFRVDLAPAQGPVALRTKLPGPE